MKVVVAPDKFKGCLSAEEVAEAIARGLREVDPAVEVDLCPMADGGEGTVAALVAATGGRMVARRVTGPRAGMVVEASFGVLGDGVTAVIEMAAASGLALLEPAQRNPMETTTYGTGELLRAAAEVGARRVILGIGGSATTDGGLGAAQACGCTVVLEDGTERGAGDAPVTGADVERVARVVPAAERRFDEILVACDVTNPLFGADGAARVYGPQKGATPEQVDRLDAALKRLAERVGQVPLARVPGAGAAGGLGFGMMAFFRGVQLRSGVEIVVDAVRLRERLADADLCITAEGRFDAQSLSGKTPIGVARVCRERGVPCVVLAGAVGDGVSAALGEGVTAWFGIADRPMALEESMGRAPELLASAAANVLRMLLARGPQRR